MVVRVGVHIDTVRVEVEDEGPGVSPAERQRVFNRLYQVDRGDDRPHEGSGIGLAIVREVVELHGGSVGCGAAAGGGALFWLALPTGVGAVAPEDLDLDTAAPEVVEAPRPVADADLPLVLVVEDHPEMREYLVGVLAEGCRVETAIDGLEGLELARRLRPAVVVSDVMMPRMDGLAMLRAMREDPVLRDLPVVVVSARTGIDDKVAGLELAQAWLGKPFYAPELRAHVHRLLQRSTVARGAAQSDAVQSDAVQSDATQPDAAQLDAAPPADEDILPEADRGFLHRLEGIVDANLDDPQFTIERLARSLAMSERTLQRELARITGASPSTWVREHRLRRGQELLRSGAHRTVSEVAAAVGMNRAWFSRAYRAWSGHAPTADLRRG